MLVFPLLFLLTFWFFRSGVAALLPLMIGGLAIVGTFLILRIASEFGSISIFALNLTTGLGLGLAIDYSLFVVSRYREEIARLGPGAEAMKRTMTTAGRTVLLLLADRGRGDGVADHLPAALPLLDGARRSAGGAARRDDRPDGPARRPGAARQPGQRLVAEVPRAARRARGDRDRVGASGTASPVSSCDVPLAIAIVTAALLIVLGIPFWNLKFTSVDAQVLPTSASARQVDDVLRTEFPPFRDTPIRLLVENGSPQAVAKVEQQLRGLDGIIAVNPPRQLPNGDTVIQAINNSPFITDSSRNLVKEIRALPDPAGSTVLVTGAAAHFVDFQHSLAANLPIALAIVVISTLIVLFLMTGSVILPIKQLVMNVLNLTAVFGILVFVFQDGRLEGLLDYRSQGALEQTMPVLLFAVAFGLSTDYGVFLLSRIKEAHDQGIPNSEAVAVGLERTGRIVTAAALLFAIAVGVFATSQIIFIKENFIGVALAVLIDASLIRALLVPSLMELLGKWNWWAPKPLRRLHERFGLSETGPEPAAG